VTGRHRSALTATQLEIVEDLIAGLTPKEIGGRRGISHHTVRSHIAQARQRTNSVTTAQLVSRIRKARPRSAERAFA
jgi:DNA-binding CsgD family transcriptional regulator